MELFNYEFNNYFIYIEHAIRFTNGLLWYKK